MVVLRDMRESDIEDYVRWFTRETSWMDTDAPWEGCETTEEEELRNWTEYYEAVREIPDGAFRRKFEIEWDGVHVGWVCRYEELEYMENPGQIPAVGIDIPETAARGHGVGTEALRQFLDYLQAHGFSCTYTQTWSGNKAMLRVAEKLGFTPVFRLRDHRTVNGVPYDAVTLKRTL